MNEEEQPKPKRNFTDILVSYDEESVKRYEEYLEQFDNEDIENDPNACHFPF